MLGCDSAYLRPTLPSVALLISPSAIIHPNHQTRIARAYPLPEPCYSRQYEAVGASVTTRLFAMRLWKSEDNLERKAKPREPVQIREEERE